MAFINRKQFHSFNDHALLADSSSFITNITTSSRTKCVILSSPLEWVSCMNLRHVSKKTKGMHWNKVTENTLKDSWSFFFITPGTQTPNSSKICHFSTNIVYNFNTVMYKAFTSKTFPSFDFYSSLITH